MNSYMTWSGSSCNFRGCISRNKKNLRPWSVMITYSSDNSNIILWKRSSSQVPSMTWTLLCGHRLGFSGFMARVNSLAWSFDQAPNVFAPPFSPVFEALSMGLSWQYGVFGLQMPEIHVVSVAKWDIGTSPPGACSIMIYFYPNSQSIGIAHRNITVNQSMILQIWSLEV